jgi:hypothetical protein
VKTCCPLRFIVARGSRPSFSEESSRLKMRLLAYLLPTLYFSLVLVVSQQKFVFGSTCHIGIGSRPICSGELVCIHPEKRDGPTFRDDPGICLDPKLRCGEAGKLCAPGYYCFPSREFRDDPAAMFCAEKRLGWRGDSPTTTFIVRPSQSSRS